MTTYAFASNDAVTFDAVVSIMTFEAKKVPSIFGGEVYAARMVVLERFYFNTFDEAQTFANKRNNGANYRDLSKASRAAAQDRADALNISKAYKRALEMNLAA